MIGRSIEVCKERERASLVASFIGLSVFAQIQEKICLMIFLNLKKYISIKIGSNHLNRNFWHLLTITLAGQIVRLPSALHPYHSSRSDCELPIGPFNSVVL